MNKIIPILSFLVLLTYSLLGQTEVSIPNVTSPTGDEVLVPINATVNDLGSVNLNVEYDTSVLTFVEVANNNLIGGSFVVNPQGNTISIAWFNTTPVDIAAKILDLKFVYNGGTSAVSFVGTNQLADALSNPINSVFNDGSVGAEPISIDLSDETGLPGDTVEVEMTAVNLENIGAMNLYINYDDSKATFVGMGNINLADFTANGVANRVNLGMFDANGFDHSSGVLATLKFVVIAGNTDLEFDASSFVQDVSFNNIPALLTGGSVGELIILESMLLGDVSAVAGTEVSVPLSALKLTNIGSFNIDVMYDDSVLEFVRFDNVISGSLVGNEVGGTLSLGYFNASGLDLVDGDIADIVFNYSGGSSAITFDAASADVQDTDFNPVALVFEDGSIVELMIPSFVNTLPDTTVEATNTLDFLYTGTHSGNAAITFSLVSGPTGASIDSAGQFSFTPVNGQSGIYDVIAGLSDGTTMVYDTAVVTVTDGTVFVYEINEYATDGSLDNDWLYNYLSAAGTINVVDSTGSAWGSHVVVFGDSAYTGMIHPQSLALSNYTVQADIYIVGPADATASLYTGLAIRMAGSEFEFYRFVYRNSSSSNNGQLRMQGYNGVWHTLKRWDPGVDFPALETGFHNFKVRVHEGEFEAFMDGQLLPGGPYTDSDPFLAIGYPGIYKYNGGYGEVMFDNFEVRATSVPEQKVVSIKEIQEGGGDSKYNGLAIKTTGIVTAAKTNTYFLQDSTGAWNGVFVYDRDNAPTVGDEVTVTAFVKEYWGKTELVDIYEFNVNSSGNTLPAPVVITASEFGEPYEGVLVRIEQAMVTDADLGYGEWELTDSTGSVRTDDVFYKSTPDSGAIVTVTGVGDYSFSNYKILPRDSSDVFFWEEGIMTLDHTPGDLSVSVFNNGTIGANKFDGINYGVGVVWKGANGLWRGGPVFGTSARGSVNGQANNNNPANFFDLTNIDSDFTSGFYAETQGTVDFDQVSDAIFTDGLAANPYGLDITQKTYSKTGDEVVYIEYAFSNNTGSDIEGFSAGIFMDYDADPYTTNTGGYSKAEELAYVYADGTNGPYFGVVAIDNMDGAKVAPSNEADVASLRQAGYGFITTFDENDEPGVGDQRLWIGTNVGTISDGGTVIKTFAIVAGDDLQGIRDNANNAFVLGKLADFTDRVVDVKVGLEIPVNYEISQNYPNPFNPSTIIQYALPLQSSVKINVYNTLGQLVTKLVDSDLTAGYHEVQFNAANLSSGVYFYSIQAESIDGSKNFQIVKKMMLVK
ncbi:MAG: cohesin domain-containing protein [Melioribacteraceae bacterium]|nr:cohesin domain-containing protein [Melioribacteraceae bacterium]